MRATRSRGRRRDGTSTTTGTTLLCLPGDLLQRVLTFLERPDVENARRVCSGLAPHGRAALRSWQWLLHDENRRATLLALWAGSAPTGHSAVEALHARTHSLTTLMPARSKVEYPGDMMHYSLKHEVTVVRPCDQESMDCGYHAGNLSATCGHGRCGIECCMGDCYAVCRRGVAIKSAGHDLRSFHFISSCWSCRRRGCTWIGSKCLRK